MGNVTRRTIGFTLLEVLVLTFFVVVLAFIGWRYYDGIRDAAREAAVRVNMRMAQIAAQAYFNDAGGKYPPASDDPAYLSYFPGGSADQKGSASGNLPINPYTRQSEAPRKGMVSDVNQARRDRPKVIGNAGEIFYSPIRAADSGEITSYAIEGAGKNGKSLSGVDKETSLVLSNSDH